MMPVDARGTRHRRCDDRAKLRIVSLVPSLTELMCELGLAQALVGRTGYWVHPAADVDRIPTIGGTKSVDVERVRALAPTHLVVDTDGNDPPTVAALEPFVPHVIVTDPRGPRDNLGLYRLFGHIFNCEREADRLAARFEAAWSSLLQVRQTAHWPTRRVLYVVRKDPWTTIARDTYIAAMLSSIDWQQLDVADALDTASPSSTRFPAIDLTRAAARVERILLSSELDAFTGTDANALRELAPRVQLVDGEMLSWYGSRAIAGLSYLVKLAGDR